MKKLGAFALTVALIFAPLGCRAAQYDISAPPRMVVRVLGLPANEGLYTDPGEWPYTCQLELIGDSLIGKALYVDLEIYNQKGQFIDTSSGYVDQFEGDDDISIGVPARHSDGQLYPSDDLKIKITVSVVGTPMGPSLLYQQQ